MQYLDEEPAKPWLCMSFAFEMNAQKLAQSGSKAKRSHRQASRLGGFILSMQYLDEEPAKPWLCMSFAFEMIAQNFAQSEFEKEAKNIILP